MSSYAVVYRGNEGSSAIIRFLKNLFTGGEAEPSVVAVQGTTPGALYHYQDFQSSSTLTTTPHAMNDAGMSGSSVSSIWSFANSRSTYASSGSSGSYNTSSQGGGSLSLPMVSSVSMQSSGSLNVSSGGSGGSSGGSSGGLSSSGGMALFAVGFFKSNLVTAVNNQSNSNADQNNQGNNGGTTGNNGNYDGDGWLNDPSEPMPVGDATVPMLIFASCYALFVLSKNRKEKA
ncbi:MAG: hypothetical protein ACP5F6_00950 [Microbacter sp.]